MCLCVPFLREKVLKKTKIGMLAGGTGITPMLQIITAVFENPADKDTTISLIYANKTEVRRNSWCKLDNP